jgi:hypothetical protein
MSFDTPNWQQGYPIHGHRSAVGHQRFLRGDNTWTVGNQFVVDLETQVKPISREPSAKLRHPNVIVYHSEINLLLSTKLVGKMKFPTSHCGVYNLALGRKTATT